jgi:hypothetical protein
MLLTLRSRRAALNLPLLLSAFAIGLGAAAAGALAKGPNWGAVVGCGLLAALVAWMALDALALVRVEASSLHVWGPLRRQLLSADACAFGVRLNAGARSSRYVVFATDGRQSVDIGEWQTERGARGGVTRLSRALGIEVPRAPSAATREVERVERTWQASLGEAQQKIDAYYKSPGWRRGKYILVGLVLAYSIGMLLYLHFTRQL